MPSHSMTSNCVCLICGTPFYTSPSNIKRGAGKYCSFACRAKAKWNTKDLAVRFWAKVQKSPDPDGCWIWTGAKQKNGYGKLGAGGRGRETLLAHRVSWEMHNGLAPEGMQVLHDCDKRYPAGDTNYRACVRPDHLFLGTNADNMADMVAKGRHAHGDRSFAHLHPDRLPRGEAHPFTRLSEAQVREIRQLYATGQYYYHQLSSMFGVSFSYIGYIVRGEARKHVPRTREALTTAVAEAKRLNTLPEGAEGHG